MKTEPRNEHKWLQKLLGEWTVEGEVMMEPDSPPDKFNGTEIVRTIGDLWIEAEGKSGMPGGDEGTTILTLGYDTWKKRFVGTWIGSMMAFLWVYDGELDPSGKVLNLDTEGPDMSSEGKTTRYREVIEFKSDDHRVWSSFILGKDGNWQRLMTADYRRRK